MTGDRMTSQHATLDTVDAPHGAPPSAPDVEAGERRHRPWGRWLLLAALAVAWVVFLFTVVFPVVEQRFNTDPTLETGSGDTESVEPGPVESAPVEAELPGEG